MSVQPIVFYHLKSCPASQRAFSCSRLSVLQHNFSKLCAAEVYHRVLFKNLLACDLLLYSDLQKEVVLCGQVRI